jgi:hypothetical protein
MDHQNVERVAYHNGIWDFQILGQSETQKFCSAAVMTRTKFSSEVNFPYLPNRLADRVI